MQKKQAGEKEPAHTARRKVARKPNTAAEATARVAAEVKSTTTTTAEASHPPPSPHLVARRINPSEVVQQAQRRPHHGRVLVAQHSPEVVAHVRHRLLDHGAEMQDHRVPPKAHCGREESINKEARGGWYGRESPSMRRLIHMCMARTSGTD